MDETGIFQRNPFGSNRNLLSLIGAELFSVRADLKNKMTGFALTGNWKLRQPINYEKNSQLEFNWIIC